MNSQAAENLERWDFLLNTPEYAGIYNRLGTMTYLDAGNPSSLDRLRMFCSAISAGIYPTSRTLVFIADCFEKYLESAGSLDDAFELKSKQKSGHPLKLEKSRDEQSRRWRMMFEFLHNNPDATQIQAAEYVKRELDRLGIDAPSEDTIVRQFNDYENSFRAK